MELKKEEFERTKKKILSWANAQDWEEEVLRCGATRIEQAGISYRFTEFAKYSGELIDEALLGSRYYRANQSIINREAPVLSE